MENNHCFRTKCAVECYSATRHLWDTPIFESKSFVVLPSVGALVEGWLLVVPKTPSLCFAQLETSAFSELEALLSDIIPIVESNYGPISMFEHGAAAKASAVGCGVDHAHLHLVPVECDLQSGAQQIAPNVRWSSVGSFKAISDQDLTRHGYWFLQQPYDSGGCNIGLCVEGELPSQLFRKVIATSLGCPEEFDWKDTAGEDRIAATVKTLAQHVVCG